MPHVFTRRHVTIAVADGTGTPITATLGPGPGDFTVSGLEEANKEAQRILNNGAYLEMTYGDDKEITGSITVFHYGDQTGTSVIDAIMKTGNFASGVTVDPGGVVWALDMTATITDGSVTNTMVFNTCRFTTDWGVNKEANSYSISFTCHEGVTRT